MTGFSETKKCSFCRKTKNWRLFVMGLQNNASKKAECRDCYRKRILPSKEDKAKPAVAVLAAVFGEDVTK